MRSLTLSVITVLLAAGSSIPAQDKTPEYFVSVGVADVNSGPIVGLKKENFRVTVNNKPVTINSIANEEEPASVAILIDTSGSIPQLSSKELSQAGKGFVEHSNQANEYMIVGFGDYFTIYQQFSSDIAETKKVLDKLPLIKRRGNTRLYDSIEAGVHLIQDRKNRVKLLLLITDGHDTSSKSDFGKIKKILRQNDIRLYSLLVEQDESLFSVMGLDRLDDLTRVTGGYVVHKRLEKRETGLAKLTENIAKDLLGVYRVGFTYDVREDGNEDWNEIEVKVDLPEELKGRKDQKIRTTYRRGFYATKSAGK